VEPTASVSAATALQGTFSTKKPLDSTSARVRVALSITTVTLGGLKSSGHDHAAAMTLA